MPTVTSLLEDIQGLAQVVADLRADRLLHRERSVRWAAEFLSRDQKTIRRYITAGKLQAVRRGRRKLYISQAELETFKAGGMATRIQASLVSEDPAADAQAESPAAVHAVRLEKPRDLAWVEQYLGCCRKTVLRHIAAGRLHSIRYSARAIMVDEDQVVALALQRGVHGPVDVVAHAVANELPPAGEDPTPAEAQRAHNGAVHRAIADTLRVTDPRVAAVVMVPTRAGDPAAVTGIPIK